MEEALPNNCFNVGKELVVIQPAKYKKREKDSVAWFTGNTSPDNNIGGSEASGRVALSTGSLLQREQALLLSLPISK